MRLSLCLALLLGLILPLRAQDDTSRFGIVEGFWRPELMCQMGMGWERLIFNWAQHQPTGPDDWNPLDVSDRWIGETRSCPREVVGLLKNTPAWATEGIANAGLPRGLHLPHDDPQNLWAAFTRRAVEHYSQRGVTRYIIWNEPDIHAGVTGYEFAGTVDDYFRLLQVAYLAAQDINPAAKIHLAGITYWHDVVAKRAPFLTRLLDRILEDPHSPANDYYFDAISLHIYFRIETIPQIVAFAREALDSRGLTDKAIWIKETNAAPTGDPDWLVRRDQFQLDLDQQAAYIVQAAALAIANGVERMAVYKLLDQGLPPGHESFGLLTPGTWQPRPAVEAYRVAIQLFSHVTASETMESAHATVIRMNIRDNYSLIVAWARRAQPVVIDIAAVGEQAWLARPDGEMRGLIAEAGRQRLELPAAKCSRRDGCFIGGEPQLLLQPYGPAPIRQLSPIRVDFAAA